MAPHRSQLDSLAHRLPEMKDVKQQLLADHAELESLLVQLGQSVDSNDVPADLCICWAHFEARLRDHLDTEERSLFPVFGARHREEIESLRAQHQQIRRTLAELGIAAELHTIRKPAVDELIALLREHAALEDRSMYDWAVGSEALAAHRGLLAMFERRLKQDDSQQ